MKTDKTSRKNAVEMEVRRRWMQWLDTEGAILRSMHFPEEILCDEEHWSDFRTHGMLHLYASKTKFTVDDIPDAQAQQLLEFLNQHLTLEQSPYSVLY